MRYRALVVVALVASGCPGLVVNVEPELPSWQEGTTPKTLRARIKNQTDRKISATVEIKRLIFSEGDANARLEGRAGVNADNVWEYTLAEEQRPETFLRSQTVEFRWSVWDAEADAPLPMFTSPWFGFRVGCEHQDIWLRADQERVVEIFDGLNPAALAVMGYLPTHGTAAFKGMGVAYFKQWPQFGEPHLLFMTPGVLNLRVVGWGYVKLFDPAIWPRKGCMPFEGWFVHEQGWHLPDGGFLPMPPGSIVFPPPGSIFHPRMWDMHIWRRDDGPPRVSIFDDTLLPDGAEVPGDTFVVVPWVLP